MSSCCDSETNTDSCSTTAPRKRPCPSCGGTAVEVGHATLLHHLKQAWQFPLQELKYYFCDSRDCNTVYFAEDDSVIGMEQIRGEVGQKRNDMERPLCYCFGVSQADVEADPAVKAFVVAQTKAGTCACDTRNPSGRCCLKDFPK